MGIQKDAGEILAFVYKKYIDFRSVETFILSNKDIEEETGWSKDRILKAIFYLNDRKLIGVGFITTSDYGIYKPTPEGIDIIEDTQKFRTTFGFSINLGLFSFSWTKEKK